MSQFQSLWYTASSKEASSCSSFSLYQNPSDILYIISHSSDSHCHPSYTATISLPSCTSCVVIALCLSFLSHTSSVPLLHLHPGYQNFYCLPLSTVSHPVYLPVLL